MTKFVAKRIYADASSSDGYRVLVDRLWPRGISKEKAKLDDWCKNIAPSDKLRKWFDHDPKKFDQFVKRYKDELGHADELDSLRTSWKKYDKVTLLYGAHDPEHNQAVVLTEYLRKEKS